MKRQLVTHSSRGEDKPRQARPHGEVAGAEGAEGTAGRSCSCRRSRWGRVRRFRAGWLELISWTLQHRGCPQVVWCLSFGG